MIKGPLEVTKNTPNMVHMRKTWVMHVQTSLLDSIGDIWSGESDVLEGANDATVESGA